MTYDVDTPDEYLKQLENDWREEYLLDIRNMILGQSEPPLEESINYKMLAYGQSSNTLFHLNAQKNYVGLYVGDIDKVDPSGELSNGINRGKGCLRFKKSTPPNETRINEFITKAVELWKQGADLEC